MADPSKNVEDIIDAFLTKFEGERKHQAIVHLALVLRAKDAIIAKQTYRIAVLSCRRILDVIAQHIINVHAKRPESCKMTDPTSALKHLTVCNAMDANFLQMFSGEAQKRTIAGALFAETSNFIFDMQSTDQMLVLPAALHSTEIHLMTRVAMYHRLDVQVITQEGMDVTEKHLTLAQRQTLRNRIEEAKSWVPKEELVMARTPELTALFADAKLAREEEF